MKRRSRDVLLGLFFALVVFLVAAQVTVTLVAERKDAARPTQLEAPVVVQEHERLAALASEGADDVAPVGTSESAGVNDDAVDTVRVYAELWEELEERLLGSPEKEEAWRNIRPVCQKHLRDLSDEDVDRLNEFLTANRDLLSRLKEAAALDGPLYALQIGSNGNDKGFLPYPFHSLTGELLAAEALVAASERRYDLLWESLSTGMRLGDAAAQVPSFIAHAYFHEWYFKALRVVEDQLPVGALPGDVMADVIAQLQTAKERTRFAEVATSTYWGSVLFLDALRHDAIAVSDMSFYPREARLLVRLHDTRLGRPWLDLFWLDREDEATAELLEQISAVALRPHWEAMDELAQMEARLPRLTPFSQMHIVAAEAMLDSQTSFEARLDLARLGLLIEQHHARHAAYPDSLEAVADGLGGEIPTDPFTGEPILYRPREGGFALYSVGPNWVDDGGEVGAWWPAGDIVWRGRSEGDDADGSEPID